jgi:hypothetical protein
MIAKLKRGLVDALLCLARPKIKRWLDTRVLCVSKQQREELAKQFGVTPELVEAVYQVVRTHALDELNRVWSKKQ